MPPEGKLQRTARKTSEACYLMAGIFVFAGGALTRSSGRESAEMYNRIETRNETK